jgi:hypothetical protein
MSGLGALFAKWNAGAIASGSLKNTCNFGNPVTAMKSTTSRLQEYPAPCNRQVIEIATVTRLQRLQPENEGVDTHAEWWRDPVELRARFDEIAGYLEFDNNCDRDVAERLALEALARELRDEHGLSDAAAMSIGIELASLPPAPPDLFATRH